jgi:alanine dehydrogenase
MQKQLTFGFPRMKVEAGERRDFLPEFISDLEKLGVNVYLEYGYGSGMGLSESDYRILAPSIKFTSHNEAYLQDYVFVLRCPTNDELKRLHPNSCLISMLHYPTRPERTEFIRSLDIEAISLDSIKDDDGVRLVENLPSVAWNGIEAAFQMLRQVYPPPGFNNPKRAPINLTLLGSGAVGIHVVQAAIRYGDVSLWQSMVGKSIPGVVVTVVDYDTAWIKNIMTEILSQTDILVDATQRLEPSKPVIPNDWIAVMPEHAILLDLSVDPYDPNYPPSTVKGIEGMPSGNLDKYVFSPDDPAFNEIPDFIPTTHRRYSVSCYSWPGTHPKKCMEVYGDQLSPIFRTLVEKEGVENIDPEGNDYERAISRSMLSRWEEG